MRTIELVKETQNIESASVINVASVPFRSPFRYPGGKTWLVPVIRDWMRNSSKNEPTSFVEPFAGGGIVALSVAFEQLADHVTMVELDKEVAAVWHTIFSDYNEEFAKQIEEFELTRENALTYLEREDKSTAETAFCTILKNRIYHGGIIAKGSGLIKSGENGKGITSRWYPKTLSKRIRDIDSIRDTVSFIEGDAFEVLKKEASNKHSYVFIDPPYLKAGKRLYTHFKINHEELFRLASIQRGNVLMTYDNNPILIDFAEKFGLEWRLIPMKTTHHVKKYELIVSNSFDWLKKMSNT